MCTNSICRSRHHARKCRRVSSGPLSQRIACGCPRSATMASNTRVTLRLAKLVSTSKAKHSRVYASTTLNTRIARPHSTASCRKSSAHSWLAEVRATSGFPSRTQCFRFFHRIINPAAWYTRCTRLWFTCSPERPSKICSRRYPKRGLDRANSTSRVRNGSSLRRVW